MSKRFNRYLSQIFTYIPQEQFRTEQYPLTDQIHVDIFESDDPYYTAVFMRNGVPICVESIIVNYKSWYADLVLDEEFIGYLETL